jgi:hypothetical protein
VTEFSKTFLVFYKWPDLTDVQVVLPGTVHTFQIPTVISENGRTLFLAFHHLYSTNNDLKSKIGHGGSMRGFAVLEFVNWKHCMRPIFFLENVLIFEILGGY